jgi:hypothetical protein
MSLKELDNFKENIYIYELVNASEWYQHKAELARIFFDFDFNGNKDSKKRFSISPSSCWLSYYDYNKIWNTDKPTLPNKNEVIDIVKNYLKNRGELISKIYKNDNLKELYLQNFFQNPRKTFITPVLHHSQKWIDHWLFQMNVELSSGMLSKSNENWKLPVFGGVLEFRIRERTDNILGGIVGFNFKFRPYKTKRNVRLISPPKDDLSQKDKDNTASSFLAFMLDGEGSPQTFLCPYFISLNDDEGEINPASEYSLCVDIIQENFGSSKIRGLVRGGSGQYEYHWSRWNPDDIFDLFKDGKSSIPFRGDNDSPKFDEKDAGINGISSAELPVGVHNVILIVEDKKPLPDTQTKIIKQTQSTIYVNQVNEKSRRGNHV